jgi:hypothetical protein
MASSFLSHRFTYCQPSDHGLLLGGISGRTITWTLLISSALILTLSMYDNADSRNITVHNLRVGTVYKHTQTFFFSLLSLFWKKKVLGRINRLHSLIRHGPHWKRCVQQFFYCCVCIRYSDNVCTEPLPSNVRDFLPSRCLATIGGIHRHTHTQTATWSNKPTLFLAYFPILKK